MDWFITWWEGIGLLGQIFATAAIPATAVMLLQTVLLLFGLIGTGGEGDGFGDSVGDDADGDSVEISEDADTADLDGLRLFTIRGIVAMLAVGGWVGVALCDLNVNSVIASIGAIIAGLGALFLSAYIIKVSLKLQDNGNFNLKNAVTHTATVYIPIPPARGGTGKVTMNLQERFVELDAITDYGEKLTTGTMVQVISVTDKNEVIVRPMK